MSTTEPPITADEPKFDHSAVILAKILSIAFLGLSSLTAGSLPVCVFERLGIMQQSRGGIANTVLRLTLNFGGGVLLSTTFVHLLPEVREGVEGLVANGTLDANGPVTGRLAELVMCVGFLIMYCVEDLAHGHGHGHGHGHKRDDPDGGGWQNPGFKIEETMSAAGRVANYNSCTSSGGNADTAGKPVQPKYASNSDAVYRSFLIIFALCIHEVFEGLAIGLEKNPTTVWSLTVAVGCHKVVIAFYIGSQMLSDRARPYLAHCSVFIFALASPVGISIGILISNLNDTNTMFLLSVVLQGLATGTLMFVMFFEVLKPSYEKVQIKQKILRLLFIIIGFSSMLFIQLMISD
ncbi:Hypothetical protein CINCED_3A000865 [Cinara cedri]|nr:Hypothetical protein CINCED_3A000865 [Cinara cedri]